MIAIRKDAMRYRDPETGKFVGVSLIGGDAPSDTSGTPVEIDGTLTQSGKAADAKAVGDRLSALNAAIDAKGDPTDEQVSTAVNAYLTENPVKAGMTATQLALLKTLGNYLVFSDATTGQAIFDNLITELEKTASGDDVGGGNEPETPTSYTITNSLTNVSTNNSATSVDANAAYTATLTPDSGYSIDSVTITMGGVNVTDTVYADGVITIDAVTGDVAIIATGAASDNLVTAEVMAQSGAGDLKDGTRADGTTTLLTPMIPVEPGTTYYTNLTRNLPDGTTVWNQKIAEYKEDKTYIKAPQYSAQQAITTMTTTAETHYIRLFFYAQLTNLYFGKSGVIV